MRKPQLLRTRKHQLSIRMAARELSLGSEWVLPLFPPYHCIDSIANIKAQWILVVTAILSSHMLFALDNTIVANIQPVSIHGVTNGGGSWGISDWLQGYYWGIPWSSEDLMAFGRVGGLLSYIITSMRVYNDLLFIVSPSALPHWCYHGQKPMPPTTLNGCTLGWELIQSEPPTLTMLKVQKCVILFMAGSALCGAAPNMDAMIIGRAMAGAGVSWHWNTLLELYWPFLGEWYVLWCLDAAISHYSRLWTSVLYRIDVSGTIHRLPAYEGSSANHDL